MLLKNVLGIGVAVALFATSCSKDEEKVDEVVAPELADAPGTIEDVPATTDLQITSGPVYFAFDEYTLSSTAQSTLTGVADQIRTAPGVTVEITGHCDERGSKEYNLALGMKRAEAVRDYLIQLGVDASQLDSVSQGEEMPAVEGTGESVWSQNRRAEFNVRM